MAPFSGDRWISTPEKTLCQSFPFTSILSHSCYILDMKIIFIHYRLLISNGSMQTKAANPVIFLSAETAARNQGMAGLANLKIPSLLHAQPLMPEFVLFGPPEALARYR